MTACKPQNIGAVGTELRGHVHEKAVVLSILGKLLTARLGSVCEGRRWRQMVLPWRNLLLNTSKISYPLPLHIYFNVHFQTLHRYLVWRMIKPAPQSVP